MASTVRVSIRSEPRGRGLQRRAERGSGVVEAESEGAEARAGKGSESSGSKIFESWSRGRGLNDEGSTPSSSMQAAKATGTQASESKPTV